MGGIYTPRRASVSVGTVREAVGEEAASVTVTEGQTLNFVLPHGIKGEKGDTGPQGPQGPSGEVADNFRPMPAETDNNIMSDLCDEVLDNGTPYVHPVTDTNNYYLNDGDCARTLLQRIKAFFVPQTRTINGHSLASNVVLTVSDVGATATIARTVTLASGSWSSKKQTVTCTGVTTGNTVLVSPDPTSYLNYHKWKIRCTGQSTNQLQFTTDGTPNADVSVQVLILNNVGS